MIQLESEGSGSTFSKVSLHKHTKYTWTYSPQSLWDLLLLCACLYTHELVEQTILFSFNTSYKMLTDQ